MDNTHTSLNILCRRCWHLICEGILIFVLDLFANSRALPKNKRFAVTMTSMPMRSGLQPGIWFTYQNFLWITQSLNSFYLSQKKDFFVRTSVLNVLYLKLKFCTKKVFVVIDHGLRWKAIFYQIGYMYIYSKSTCIRAWLIHTFFQQNSIRIKELRRTCNTSLEVIT